jgi:hypothetical protein
MMKIRRFFLSYFLANVLIGLASITFIRCNCQSNPKVPKDKPIVPEQKPLLTEITNDMIDSFIHRFPFLSSQLKKLQKEPRVNNKVAYN